MNKSIGSLHVMEDIEHMTIWNNCHSIINNCIAHDYRLICTSDFTEVRVVYIDMTTMVLGLIIESVLKGV